MDDSERLYRRMLKVWGVGQLHLVDDTGPQQVAQVQIGMGGPGELSEVQDKVPRLGEYGLASCPPDGAEAVILYLGGQRSMGTIIATGHRASRILDLLAGEAVLYNGVRGSQAKMADDGKLHINCDIVLTGSITATGDIEDHSADGKGATMEAMRTTYDGHTHPAGTPNTGAPNQQMPD